LVLLDLRSNSVTAQMHTALRESLRGDCFKVRVPLAIKVAFLSAVCRDTPYATADDNTTRSFGHDEQQRIQYHPVQMLAGCVGALQLILEYMEYDRCVLVGADEQPPFRILPQLI
jgi:hypothetical protein